MTPELHLRSTSRLSVDALQRRQPPVACAIPGQNGHGAGMVTYFWLTPPAPGNSTCFASSSVDGAFRHARRVVVDEQNAFQAWLSSQPTYSETRAQVAGNASAAGALCRVQRLSWAQAQGNRTLNARS